MKGIFLGTGSAVPTAKRNHMGILLSFGSENILVDCGEGIQRQFKIAKLNPCKLTKILITHWHGDHVLGLPGLLQTLALSNYQKVLEIYGPKGTLKNMNLIKQLNHEFNIKYNIIELDEKNVDFSDFIIEALPMEHKTPCNAYSIILKDKLRIDRKKMALFNLKPGPEIKQLLNGKSIKAGKKVIKSSQVCFIDKGKKVSFILDTKYNKNCLKIAKNADVLISESTYGENDEDKAKEYFHMTSKDSANIAKKANVKKLFIVHLSDRYEKDLSIILKEAKSNFKQTFLAKDFDSFSV